MHKRGANKMFTLPYPKNSAEVYLAIAAGMTGLAYPYLPGDRVPTTEIFLAHLAGDFSHPLPSPKNRTEVLLAHAVGDTSVPIIGEIEGRVLIGVEMVDIRYLAYLAGVAGTVLPEGPENRTEEYFAAIASGIPAGAVLKTAKGLDITLNDVLGGIKSLDYIYGDTTQQTYSGKNLFSTSFVASTNISTVTGPDSIKLIKNDTQRTARFNFSPALPAGNYSFSFKVDENSGGNSGNLMDVSIRPNSGGEYAKLTVQAGQTGGTSVSINATGEIGYIYFYILQEQADNSTISISNIQLETGSTATAYEPYTGGYASPSPMYPQEVQTVTGRQVVEVSGKNLFNLADTTQVSTGVSVVDDGYITCIGDNSSGTSTMYLNYWTGPLALDASSNYSIVLEIASCSGEWSIEGGGDNQLTAQVQYFGVSYQEVTAGDVIVKNIMSKGDVSGSNGIRMYFRFLAGQSGSIKVRVSVIKGNSVTPQDFVYQPYTKATYNVSLGSKNLLNIPDATATNRGLTISFKNGVGTISGEYSGTGTNIVFPIQVKIPAGTYTLSSNNSVANYPYVALNGPDGAIISTEYAANTKTITIPQDVIATQINMYFGAAREYEGATFKPQLELGSVATAYEPYFTPIELCKIGNKQDYIYKDGADWYLHREVRHLSLPVADMNNSNSYPGWINLSTLVSDLGTRYNGSLGDRTPYRANLATGVKNTQYNVYSVSVNTNGSGTLFLSKTYFNNVYGGDWTQDYWKTTFPNLVFELYYGIISTPEDERITDATLVSQLNALSSAVLPKPGANIAISGNLAGEIEISYWGKE